MFGQSGRNQQSLDELPIKLILLFGNEWCIVVKCVGFVLRNTLFDWGCLDIRGRFKLEQDHLFEM